MKLAFSGQGRYPDLKSGYALYVHRNRTRKPMDEKTYNRVVKRFCAYLADLLEENGCVDLPCELGTVSTAVITRKPRYRYGEFVGFGAKNWKTGEYDGNLKAFGVVYLPKHDDKKQDLRCYGFVANRKLFQRLKAKYIGYECPWTPLNFNDKMI